MLVTSFRPTIRQNDHSFSVKEAEVQKLEATINLSPNQGHTEQIFGSSPSDLAPNLMLSACQQKSRHPSMAALLTSGSH